MLPVTLCMPLLDRNPPAGAGQIRLKTVHVGNSKTMTPIIDRPSNCATNRWATSRIALVDHLYAIHPNCPKTYTRERELKKTLFPPTHLHYDEQREH